MAKKTKNKNLKSPKEAAEIFNNIIKASVKPPVKKVVKKKKNE